jgi:hypothetical protein
LHDFELSTRLIFEIRSFTIIDILQLWWSMCEEAGTPSFSRFGESLKAPTQSLSIRARAEAKRFPFHGPPLHYVTSPNPSHGSSRHLVRLGWPSDWETTCTRRQWPLPAFVIRNRWNTLNKFN